MIRWMSGRPGCLSVVMGTVGYMAPEQVEAKDTDARSDIFSFGCILYEAITGRRAFSGSSHVATMHTILQEEPAPVEEFNPQVAPELQRIVRKCLQKQRERRYQSMKEIAVDLRDVYTQVNTVPIASPAQDGAVRRACHSCSPSSHSS